MWGRLSKMAGLASTDPETIVAENQQLKHQLEALSEDYEILKDAHRRALEQMMPEDSSKVRDMVYSSPITSEYSILKESNAKLQKQLRSLSAIVKIESAQVYQNISKERIELAKIREQLQKREAEINTREIELQASQMLKAHPDTDLTDIIKQNIQINQDLEALQVKNEQLRSEVKRLKSAKDQDRDYNQIIQNLHQKVIEVRRVQQDQSLKILVEEAQTYFIHEMKSFEKKWYELMFRMGTLQKDLKETKDKNIKIKKETEMEIREVEKKFKNQIDTISQENERLKHLLMEKEKELIAEKNVMKNAFFMEPKVEKAKQRVETEEQFYDTESINISKNTHNLIRPNSTVTVPPTVKQSIIPTPAPIVKQPIISTPAPLIKQPIIPTPAPIEKQPIISTPAPTEKQPIIPTPILKESALAPQESPIIPNPSPISKESTLSAQESPIIAVPLTSQKDFTPTEELKQSTSSLESDKSPLPSRQPMLQKMIPRMGARVLKLRSSKPASEDIDLEEILGSSAPSMDQLKRSLGNFKS